MPEFAGKVAVITGAERGIVRDDDIALALIVQDGGLYYYGRTIGFVFA